MRLPDISAEYVLAVAVRAGLGLLFGVLMGVVALLVTFWVVPGLYTPPLWMLVMTTSIGCSISGSLSYYKPETAWNAVGKSVLIVVIGAIIGAWIGFWWGQVFYPEGVRNEQLVAYGDIRSPPVMAFITWSAIGSTFTGGAYYAFRAWRYHEV
jgi:hypothetical protein